MDSMQTLSSRAHRVAHILLAGIRTLRSRDFGVDLATVQDGLDLTPFERLAKTMAADADGQWLLAHRPRITLADVDVDALRRLPDGYLGREVIRHLENAGLLQDIALKPSPFQMSSEAEYARTRWRETHDIRHVLTGLGVSLRDEIVLQAFQLGQFPNRFALVQMTVGPLLEPTPPLALIRDYRRAYLMGQQAQSLINIRWESLWEERVEDVRARVGVGQLA